MNPPEIVASGSSESPVNHAGYGAHQQIVTIPESARVALMVVSAIACSALGIAIYAANSAWNADREGRIAQSHIDEVTRLRFDPLEAKVAILSQSPPTLIIKEECHK
jgi:hypothetical protein